MVVGDFHKFSEGEGILSVLVLGLHCVFCCYVGCRWGRRNLVSKSCLDFSVQLDRQRRLRFSGRVPFALPAYSHFRSTHTPLMLTLLAYLHAARTHTSGVLMRRSFSNFRHSYALLVLTLPVYSRATRTYTSGILTCHLYSHALRGFIVFAVSVTPGLLYVASVLTRST